MSPRNSPIPTSAPSWLFNKCPLFRTEILGSAVHRLVSLTSGMSRGSLPPPLMIDKQATETPLE